MDSSAAQTIKPTTDVPLCANYCVKIKLWNLSTILNNEMLHLIAGPLAFTKSFREFLLSEAISVLLPPFFTRFLLAAFNTLAVGTF